MNNMKVRWKMIVMVMPLVIIPILVVGGVVGSIGTRQAYLGITKTSKDDLEHMAGFTLDLLNSHYQQFQVYKQDKRGSFERELATLVNLSYNLVQAEQHQAGSSHVSQVAARQEARKALTQVNVGESGYIYAMTSKGKLEAHIARQGQNVYDEKDENGRYFIREMCLAALKSSPGEVLYITYPWRNAMLGDKVPRKKVVAYRYFREWDWIIAAGGYVEETYEDVAFERRSFAELREKIKAKKVGDTGYIYCMDSKGTLVVHPNAEGQNIYGSRDLNGNAFIREMCEKKRGWIRYPWKNQADPKPRMKIVRYEYFEPWGWIVAVGSYEDEFYREANKITGRIQVTMFLLVILSAVVSVLLVNYASKILTNPISHMMEVIRKVKGGRLEERMSVDTNDELGELAAAFNRMTDIIRKNREMEATLAQQGKMASLGILSSGVAHEINNPLGVILGFASHIEGKLSPDDPNYKYVSEIKRESKRCKKIVQNLLSYARTPKPALEETDVNALLDQIVNFASNHTDMHQVRVEKDFARDIPLVMADGDQLRQVAINLILNAGAAMPEGGTLVVKTFLDGDDFVNMVFADSGAGIPPENLEKLFEPFFTTKATGTGLGLAITRQIIEQHQGKITVESRVGEGTVVTVRIPLKRDEFQ
jgi:two-component system NtrC family sensor kinase